MKKKKFIIRNIFQPPDFLSKMFNWLICVWACSCLVGRSVVEFLLAAWFFTMYVALCDLRFTSTAIQSMVLSFSLK